MHSNGIPSSDCCGAPAMYQLVYMDDSESLLTCLDHFGHSYDLAERTNAGRTFLPVHISKIEELIPA